MRTRFPLLPLLLLAFTTALAEETPTHEAETSTLQTAVFTVPDVDDEDVVRALTKALATREGVVSAKADTEADRFQVTFDPEKTEADELAAIVIEVSPEAELETVKAAEAKATGHDCGKCPSRAKCGKAKTDHAKSAS